MRVFPQVTKGSERLKYIFPSKQRDAQIAINIASADERIERLIVFGSAVTPDCGTDSDIDIAVSAKNITEDEFLKIAHAFYTEIDSEVDIVHYESVSDAFFKSEIDKKGVTLYAKRS